MAAKKRRAKRRKKQTICLSKFQAATFLDMAIQLHARKPLDHEELQVTYDTRDKLDKIMPGVKLAIK